MHNNGNSKNSRRGVSILCIILGVVIALAGLISFGVNVLLDQIPRIDPSETYDTGDPLDIPGETLNTEPATEEAETVPESKDILNILLVGQTVAKNDTLGPSDSMILCTLNKASKKLTLTSFHSDLWVYIPDNYNERLSMSCKLGGVPLLDRTLEYNFGVRPDYNITVNLSGFQMALDTIGGVEIQLLAGEAKCLNDFSGEWTLQEGKNTLTGEQALAYARIRESGTDFGKTNRQRTVITAIVQKIKSMNADEATALLQAVLPLLSTDMTNDQILALAAQLLPMLGDLEINSQNIPAKGTYKLIPKGEKDALIMTKEQIDANIALIVDTVTQP